MTTEPGVPPVAGLGPVQVVPIDSVRPAPDNPRVITDRAVKQTALSIRRFGWQQPLVVDRDGVLIVGHTRHRAAKSLGLQTVPVTVAEHLTAEEARAYRITDNRTSDFTSWDLPELTVQLEALASDFSDVLALADWQAIVADFNELDAGSGGLDVEDDVVDYVGSKSGWSVTVVCSSQEATRRVAAAVVDVDGVLDVRDNRA